MSGSTQPTLVGFQWFIANVMNIDPLNLPSNTPVIAWSLAVALNFVNPDLACIGNNIPGLPVTNIYVEATYNLAADILLNFAQDQAGRNYFADLRKSLGMNSFSPGVVASSADQSTSTSNLNPEFMKNLTLANLQNLKTSYGRAYLAMAQLAGPSIWGLS